MGTFFDVKYLWLRHIRVCVWKDNHKIWSSQLDYMLLKYLSSIDWQLLIFSKASWHSISLWPYRASLTTKMSRVTRSNSLNICMKLPMAFWRSNCIYLLLPKGPSKKYGTSKIKYFPLPLRHAFSSFILTPLLYVTTQKVTNYDDEIGAKNLNNFYICHLP